MLNLQQRGRLSWVSPPLWFCLIRFCHLIQSQLITTAPLDNFILAENFSQMVEESHLNMTSDIPVTIQRYSYKNQLPEGGRPLSRTDVKVVITSDCNTFETPLIPNIEIGENGIINVNLGMNESHAESMPFLESSWYQAIWSYVSFWCYGTTLPTVTFQNDITDVDSIGNTSIVENTTFLASNSSILGNFCGKSWEDANTSCARACPTGEDDDCTSTLGEDYQCQQMTSCFDRIQSGEVTPGAFTDNTSNTSILSTQVNVLSSESATSVLPLGGDDNSTNYEDSPATSETNLSSIIDSEESMSYFFPTISPRFVNISDGPTTNFPTFIPTVTSASLPFRHSWLLPITTILVLAVIAATFLGDPENRFSSIVGVGSVVLAAMFSNTLFHNSVVLKTKITPTSSHKTSSLRELQTCTYHADILFDGCAHSFNINAPAARILDVLMKDLNETQDAKDQCITNYTAKLYFPVTENATQLNLEQNVTVGALASYDCESVVEGRPFIDLSGRGLLASPQICYDNDNEILSCFDKKQAIHFDSSKTTGSFTESSILTQEQFLLGEEWIQRGLGEHASVASFSAFSISLLTNHAPQKLVAEAMKAGLDELRHTQISFDIASKLLGREIIPGPLPASNLEFRHDLTALALAVAREGCVDETLSALSASIEIDRINDFLEKGLHSIKYSNIDHNILRWIKDQLHTIALDESNHATLAWETLIWICNVDSYSCEVVKQNVFNDDYLYTRLIQRSGGKSSFYTLLKEEWMHKYAIYSKHDFHRLKNDTEWEGAESYNFSSRFFPL